MGVLAMLEIDGDTDALMAAVEKIGAALDPPGLVARIVAPTDTGMVLFQWWESAEARERNAQDAAHFEALAASGIRELMKDSRSREFEGAEFELLAGDGFARG